MVFFLYLCRMIDATASHLLLRDVHLLGNTFPYIQIKHTWNESNMCGYFTAIEDINLVISYIFFYDLHQAMFDLISQETSK